VKGLDAQRIALIGWVIFAAVYCAGAIHLGVGQPSRPRPGFMPLLISLFLGGVALISLLHSLLRKGEAQAESQGVPVSIPQLKKSFLIYSALIGYGLFLDRLGFMASTSLLMLFLFKGIESQKWWVAIILTVVTVGLSYFIFVVWLGCQFPTLFR